MIKKFYDGLSEKVKASFWYIFSNGISSGVQFLTLPIFTRLMTTEEYGILSLYTSWQSIISILATLTIWGGVFNVAMVRYESRKDEVLSTFQGLSLTLTLFVTTIIILVYPLIQRMLGLPLILIVMMMIEVASGISYNLWMTKQKYDYRYLMVSILKISISLMSPFIGFVFVLNAKDKALAKILSSFIVNVLIGIIFVIYNQIKGKKFIDIKLWRFAFLFNIVLVPHYLSMQVLNQSDRIMISSICGTNYAGIYSIAYSFSSLVLLVTSGINSSLTPHIYQSLKEGNVAELRKQSSIMVVLVGALSILFMALVPDVFLLALPETYYPAAEVIPPIVAGNFFLFLYPLFGSVEFYYEENRYVMMASFIGAVLNVLLNYFYINKYGFKAAAYTTLICYIGFSICHYLFMNKVLRKNKNEIEIYNIKCILFTSIVVVFSAVIFVLLYDKGYIRWFIDATAVVFAIIYRKQIFKLFSYRMKG